VLLQNSINSGFYSSSSGKILRIKSSSTFYSQCCRDFSGNLWNFNASSGVWILTADVGLTTCSSAFYGVLSLDEFYVGFLGNLVDCPLESRWTRCLRTTLTNARCASSCKCGSVCYKSSSGLIDFTSIWFGATISWGELFVILLWSIISKAFFSISDSCSGISEDFNTLIS
jgi:hypothetical protein